MKRAWKFVAGVIVTMSLMVPAGVAAGGLDAFHGEINIRAQADLGAFKADLGATFGLPAPRIDSLFDLLPSPADVYMTLRVGEVSHQPIDRVVEEFKRNRGQGWGVIAKNLGIKPGSPEFHALKQGRLKGGGIKAGPSRHAHGGGKSKGKGRK